MSRGEGVKSSTTVARAEVMHQDPRVPAPALFIDADADAPFPFLEL